ncbi:MAG: PilN domain-containing protein [Candidatus Omnitrophota bacterium]
MIDINLIPQHLRRKKKKSTVMGMTSIPMEAIIGLIGGLVILLVLVHILLTAILVLKFTQKSKVENDLKSIEKEWKAAKDIKQQLQTIRNKINAVEKVTTENRISWAQKLNDISDSLPKGVWLNKLSLDRNFLLIDGSAVSKEGIEMQSPQTFILNLKNRQSFVKGVENIDIGSIQRRQIKSVQIADFLITVKLQ